MATDMEKARVTELHVRMDCNGCVHRIKKALNSIDGVYDVYIDFPQQKITVVGRVEPEVLVKAAIKRTKKMATVCSHTDVPASAEPVPSTEPATDPQVASEAPPPAVAAAAAPAADASTEPPSPQEPKDVEEVHMVHHYPHDNNSYVHGEHWGPAGHGTRQPAPSYYVNHSYSSHRPPPYVSEYVADRYDGHRSSPPRHHGSGAYGDGYYQNHRGDDDGNQMTTIFSDENPNACRIV